jgi:hypothetical protein
MHLCILPWADDLNPPPAAKLSNHLDCVERLFSHFILQNLCLFLFLSHLISRTLWEAGESSNQITQLAAQIVRKVSIPLRIQNDKPLTSLRFHCFINHHEKLKLRYSPNNIRNPALQYHYDFLAAKYLNEKFEPAEDQSLPRYPDIREVRHGFSFSQPLWKFDLNWHNYFTLNSCCWFVISLALWVFN